MQKVRGILLTKDFTLLVLTRKKGQQIIIGDDIVLTFIEYQEHNGGMRIGIEAPSHINIVRKEIATDRKKIEYISRINPDE